MFIWMLTFLGCFSCLEVQYIPILVLNFQAPSFRVGLLKWTFRKQKSFSVSSYGSRGFTDCPRISGPDISHVEHSWNRTWSPHCFSPRCSLWPGSEPWGTGCCRQGTSKRTIFLFPNARNSIICFVDRFVVSFANCQRKEIVVHHCFKQCSRRGHLPLYAICNIVVTILCILTKHVGADVF